MRARTSTTRGMRSPSTRSKRAASGTAERSLRRSELLRAVAEVRAVHGAEERVVDAVRRCAADDRVDSAGRAQRGLLRIYPRLDRCGRESPEAEEATTLDARLELGAVLGSTLVSSGECGIDRLD